MKPESDPVLRRTFSHIGKPAPTPFTPDAFQLDALEAIKKTDCLVMAPTGAGKTWIAEKAIDSIFKKGGRCWYASPLKALTNSKWVEFGDIFGTDNVGILTGDTKENAEAPVVVGTTEILRNQLYDAMHRGLSLEYDLVILDEAHFLGDMDRGVVWEETMIYLPERINLLLLSATIGNGHEIAEWLGTLRRKECIVIEENKRPVPLYPLFLHPSGHVMPLMEGKRLYKKVAKFMEKTETEPKRGGKLPPFGEIIKVLGKYRLLPALFFLKSRSECDAALNLCKPNGEMKRDRSFENQMDATLRHFPFLRDHRQLFQLTQARVGAHHGGQLPAWKFTVETMMKKGYLDAVFATTTVAAGVNFPARTVVIFNSDQFNGQDFLPLNATEFHQMTGRAGRRGQDRIGFVVAYPGRFMDLAHVRKLLSAEPERILSRIRNDFSMVLNLLLSHSPKNIKEVFERSFAEYQRSRHKNGERTYLWEDFLRHLEFLKGEGFVDEKDLITEDGKWASQLRLDQPLLIAECLKRGAFPEEEPLLSAVMALFVYDRDHEVYIPQNRVPRRLRKTCENVIKAVSPLARRMKSAGFDVAPLPLWAAFAIYEWARGVPWEKVTDKFKIADGDLAMLISRTADSLNQIASLRDTYPDIAESSIRGRKLLLREPVVFE